MEFLPFFIVLLVGILFSVVFRRFHLPWVLALIAAGIAVGPYGFELVETSPTIEFIGQVGLIFLMFMAGLETKLSSFREYKRELLWLSLLNTLIPFAAGYLIGYIFNFGPLASALLGIIFISSSIAVIIPTLESTKIINTKLGHSIVSATIVQDVASLLLLSVLLQMVDPITVLPLPSFYILLAIILVSFRYGLPKLRELIPKREDGRDLFESEVRVIIAMLIGVVVTFELLGLHPIIAGFFAGLVLSESIKSEVLIEKLRTIGYGIFIPVFFVIIGMETDVRIFADGFGNLSLVLFVILGSMLTKFLSGWIGARIGGFKNDEALTVGFATMPQLSTTLAVVFAGVELGLLENELITAMVMLSIVSTLFAPILIRSIHRPLDVR